MEPTPLQRAIEKAGGSQRALAALIAFSQQAVSKWHKGVPVPAEACVKIERATGIPRHELRPDLFDAPQQERAA